MTSIGQAEPATDARRRFDAGNAAYSRGEFVHAAEEYKAAFKEKQDPVFLYNIAQAYRLAGDAKNAVFFYRSYLRNLPNARNRHEIEDRITKLERQPSPPPPADQPAPEPGPMTPPRGKHGSDSHQTPPIIPHPPGGEPRTEPSDDAPASAIAPKAGPAAEAAPTSTPTATVGPRR